MSCKYFTLFFFMFTLKLQLLELKHSQTWLWKQLGKNFINIPAFETLEKVNRYTKSSFKPSLGCSDSSPPCVLGVVAVFPPLNLAALTQHATSGQGTACSLSTAHKRPSQVFKLEMISLIFF
jgi:hypothetical protein